MFSRSIFIFLFFCLKYVLYFRSYVLTLISLSILITSVLNSASGRFLVSILFRSFSGVLFYSFIWDVFLGLPTLAASLCLFLCIR